MGRVTDGALSVAHLQSRVKRGREDKKNKGTRESSESLPYFVHLSLGSDHNFVRPVTKTGRIVFYPRVPRSHYILLKGGTTQPGYDTLKQ